MSVKALRLGLALCQDSLSRFFFFFCHKSQSAVKPPQRFEVTHKDTPGAVQATVKIKLSLTAGGWTENTNKTLNGKLTSSIRTYSFGSQ